MSFKLLKMIFNIIAITLVILSFVLFVFNSIKVDIRWYGTSYKLDLYSGDSSLTKVYVGSINKKASAYNIAFGSNGFRGSFINQLIIFLLGAGLLLLVLRFIFSFIEKMYGISAIIGLICGWGLLVISILIWLLPIFANFSNEILSIIDEYDAKGYEIIVEKTMTPSIFLAGFLSFIGGLSVLLSTHLRYD